MKNGHISIDKYSGDKIVDLQKWLHVIKSNKQKQAANKSEKESTPLGALSKQRSQLPIVFLCLSLFNSRRHLTLYLAYFISRKSVGYFGFDGKVD